MLRELYHRLRQDLSSSASGPATPQRKFWRGAALGAIGFTLAIWAIGGYHFATGLSPLLMLLIGGLLGGVAIAVFAVLSLLVAYGSRALPNAFYAVMGGAIGALIMARFVAFRWPDELYYPLAFFFLWVNALLVGSLWRWWARPTRRGIGLASAIIGLLLIDGFGVYSLVQDGRDPFPIAVAEPSDAPTLAEAGLPDPAEPGPLSYDYFTYGNGTDQQRPEYRTEVRYRTPTVDASRLLPEWKGKKKKWRERYWGFGVDSFPLNGRVWLPTLDEGPLPIALIVHGNHGMEDYSDGGYAYLGELLASHGIIAVSIDENFINGTWSGDFRGREMPTRAWLLLKHLQQWRDWNADADHPLAGRADLDRVLLIGHSRGGEAVAIAAAYNELPRFPDDAREAFDFGFGIRGLVAIAPTDKRYQRRVELENVNYLTLQGTYDSDESSLFGWRQAQRIRFTDTTQHFFKSALLIHRANHGQFNTTWGRTDMGAPSSWLLNLDPLLPAAEQQRIAQVYISAFAQSVFGETRDYLPLFRESATGRDWLPTTTYINLLRDSRDQILLDFEEDIDPTTGPAGIALAGKYFATWREEELRFRDRDTQGNNALVLGWKYSDDTPADSIPEYVISLPPGSLALADTATHLLISLGPAEPEKPEEEKPAPDFTIVLVDSLGRQAQLAVADFEPLPPALRVQYMKSRSLSARWGSLWELALESYAIPLPQFTGETRALDPGAIREIRLRMDRASAGEIVVDDVGWR